MTPMLGVLVLVVRNVAGPGYTLQLAPGALWLTNPAGARLTSSLGSMSA